MEYYVHLHAINYENYGIDTVQTGENNSGKTESVLKQYLEKHNNIINEYVNSKEKLQNEELENFYKKVFFEDLSDSSSDKIYKKLRDEYIKNTEEVLKQKFEEKAGAIDRNHLLSVGVSDNPNERNKKYKELLNQICNTEVKNLDEAQYNFYSTYQNRVNQLRKILKSAMKKENLEFRNSLEAILQTEKIAKDISDLREQLDILLNRLGRKKSSQISTDNMVTIKGKKVNSFEYLNSIIEAIGKLPALATQSNQAGIAGEIAAGLYQYYINGVVENVELEISKDFLNKGSDIFKGSQYISDTITSPLKINAKGKQSSIEITETKNKSTSKTDVKITIKEGEPVRLSVKNYKSLKGQLTLVSGTPLSKLLYSLDDSLEFEGHYANLIAESIDFEKNDIISKYRGRIKTIIMQQALISAFEGYNKKKKPTVFVVFGSKDNQVKVYNLKPLIGNFFKGKGEYFIESKHAIKEQNLSNIKSLTIPRKENGKAMTNAAKALFQAHKLHVAINLGL